MRRFSIMLAATAVLAWLASSQCPAWLVKGHGTITEAAAARLPDKVPAFFRAGGTHMAHFSGDPDRWKNPKAKYVRNATSADHYIDLEYMEGWEFPPLDRYKAITLCRELGRPPERVGMLPYAILEYFDRLTCAFYDHRQDPKNTSIHMKCLVYGGTLAHFTGDTTMPLHTTMHYDGLRRPGKKSLQKGIHFKIDGFPENNDFTWEEISRDLKPKEIDDVWAYVLKTIGESHVHVQRCYELDKAGAIDKPTDESRAFIMERCRAGAQFTMDLWYAAWQRSEKMPPHY